MTFATGARIGRTGILMEGLLSAYLAVVVPQFGGKTPGTAFSVAYSPARYEASAVVAEISVAGRPIH